MNARLTKDDRIINNVHTQHIHTMQCMCGFENLFQCPLIYISRQ